VGEDGDSPTSRAMMCGNLDGVAVCENGLAGGAGFCSWDVDFGGEG
jgi:hypothetical protein